MASNKLRNRIVAAAVYALLAGGTVYGFVRSEQLDTDLEEAADAHAGVAALADRMTEANDSLRELLAIPPDTVVREKIVRIHVPPDTVVRLRVDTIELPPITVTDTVVETVRVPVPGPARVDTLYRRTSFLNLAIASVTSFAAGYVVRVAGWEGKSCPVRVPDRDDNDDDDDH